MAQAPPIARQDRFFAWRLDWLTPARCRLVFAGLMLLGFLGHLDYLRNGCPIGLSGDEAQYWDWSRTLDICYYSKGPLIAWIIRASTSAFGRQMWAVRLPALVLAVAISCLTYWLTLRLFKSDRLALGVILLNHLVPMFVAGSLLMTIDPPYFLCWGLASAFLALATLEGRKWAWAGAGLAIGLGTLAKYGMLLWPVGMFAFLIADDRLQRGGPFLASLRRSVLRPGPWVALLIGVSFLALPIAWNIRHDWVSFRHVLHQTGATKKRMDGNFLELLLSQIFIIGPALFPLVVGAIAWAMRSGNRKESFTQATAASLEATPPARRAEALLLWMGLPIFAICLLGSIRSKMQANWPAAAYFSWVILTARFISTRMSSALAWKRWRGWVWGTIVFGIVMAPIAHNVEHLYPLMHGINRVFRKTPMTARDFDVTAKLKGWPELGRRVSEELAKLDQGFVIGRDYQITAELAFYVEGQPKTFCIGGYLADPKDRERRTQYDVWPQRRLDQPHLVGRDAIFVGYRVPDLHRVFEKVERLPDVKIYRRGSPVRRFDLYRCTRFKGMTLPEAEAF